jgi:hypothetical protein
MPPNGIEWLDDAAADIRAVDRSTAMRIFEGVLHFARTGSGNVTTLHGDMAGPSVCAWEIIACFSPWRKTP